MSITNSFNFGFETRDAEGKEESFPSCTHQSDDDWEVTDAGAVRCNDKPVARPPVVQVRGVHLTSMGCVDWKAQWQPVS
jgi:hypothetical protein